MASGLFGIEHTNRADLQHWTKNRFNSSFPAALANYMLLFQYGISKRRKNAAFVKSLRIPALISVHGQMILKCPTKQQTDKEVSVPGDRWRRYITTNRTLRPAVQKSAINEIIASGYIENLRPERRFDQTLYFTARQTE